MEGDHCNSYDSLHDHCNQSLSWRIDDHFYQTYSYKLDSVELIVLIRNYISYNSIYNGDIADTFC